MSQSKPEDYSTLRRRFENFALVQEFPEEPAGLYQPVRYMMSLGGKRVRPVFVLMSCEMFGGLLEQALPASFGIELFHNYTLMHDDIMDKADKRRGKPTVHKTYGLNAGILSGDLTMVLSYQYLLQSGSELQLLPTFNQAAREICEGQQMDMDFEQRTDVSYQEYLEMIRLKTAVLLGVSLKVGATVAGASEAMQQEIYKIGELLGISFQLMDDWLDSFGSGEKVGKKIGGDIFRNKKTGLFIKAYELTDDRGREALDKLYAQTKPSQEKLETVLFLMKESGAKEFIEAEMESYYNKALNLLGALPIPEENKLPLRQLATGLYNREA
jgi:geranylgeranyl diphosphate synthase type II